MTSVSSPADLQRLMGTPYAVSDQQWAAISAPLEPALVIAGAGSGKTSVMATRVVYLVVTGQVRPDQVLGLTFTTKAAGELGTRIREALDAAGFARGVLTDDGTSEILQPVVATYNSFASALLAEHGLRIGHEPDTRVIADAARYQLAGRVVDAHTAPVAALSDSPSHVIGWLLGLDAALAEHLVTPEQLRDHDQQAGPRFVAQLTGAEAGQVAQALAGRAELLSLVEEYRTLKRRLGLMDFSDQIALAARLAHAHPAVAEAERQKHRVVLLDEYQDTSVAQVRMLSSLFGIGHPVTAVGDPNQAIYGWRGASVSNISRFADDFGRDGAVATFPLTVNRRSDRRILLVANEIARPLAGGPVAVRPLEPGCEETGRVAIAVHETDLEELDCLGEQIRQRGAAAGRWSGIAVLTRDNQHAAEVFDALTGRDVPVEIVGLKGLLRLPEVADVLATLTLVHDPTANADLLGLLTGPRWAIGPRDLALLGRRARDLSDGRQGRPDRADLARELDQAVAGADPTEVTALTDALADLGDLSYSPEARSRFALLAGELRHLRAHAGEPLLDLVRRIIDVCGIDVELAAAVSPAARARRENLDLFVKAVAEFQAIDGQVTLPALLAWLEAENDGEGLDVATPSEADSVKLLTVHRAKGLEWDSVFLVGACEGRFPHTRSRGLWPKRRDLLPTPLRGDAVDLPALTGYDNPALQRLKEDTKTHESLEERRLGYVALTRARHDLVVSSYLWRRGRKKPLGPSPYQVTIRDLLTGWGEVPQWRDKPPDGTQNPLRSQVHEVPWPRTEGSQEHRRRVSAAAQVHRLVATEDWEDPDLDIVDAARVAEWDADIDRLLAEARQAQRSIIEVPMPASVSATSLARLRDDPAGFAADLARPMPRPPAPAARFGTRFHAWVEGRFGQQDLIDPDELPGRADAEIDDFADLAELVTRFEQGPFGDRPPHRIEASFAVVLSGQVVRGRIDAVYQEPDGGYLVVDWKTGRHETADPIQLALYRLAWAELAGVPLGRVRAAFYYVRSGRLVAPPDLLDRDQLTQVVGGP